MTAARNLSLARGPRLPSPILMRWWIKGVGAAADAAPRGRRSLPAYVRVMAAASVRLSPSSLPVMVTGPGTVPLV